MHMNTTPEYTFNDIILLPQFGESIGSRKDINIATKIAPNITLDLPFLSANMTDVTNATVAVEMHKMGAIGVLPRFNTIDEQLNMWYEVRSFDARAFAAIGITGDYTKRAQMLTTAGITGLVIDVAHIHTTTGINAIKKIRQTFSDIPLIAGNLVTYKAATACWEAGADAVKVGIGPGSLCTTRQVTGHGRPQLSAIMDIYESRLAWRKVAPALWNNKYIIADGGMVSSGDVTKALAAGADAIMSGFLFAGSNDGPGKWTSKNGQTVRQYRGSTTYKDTNIEGIEAWVPGKGYINQIVQSLKEGVQSGLSYTGARNLQELRDTAKFQVITSHGYTEGLTNNVIANS